MSKFDPYHSQFDHETGVVDVHYDGELDEEAAIEYAKRNYCRCEGVIVYNHPPESFKGFVNPGIVGIK
jgi:hypothetical protein